MNSLIFKPTYLLYLTTFLLLSNFVSAQMITPLPDTTTAKVKNHLAPASQNDTVGNTITLDSKDFNQGFIVSPEELILGKVAGLRITSNSGKPGDGFTIQNRGISTFLTDNSPLYIVDNVPIVNGYININPNDIATVTVMKDAWAVALYGDRAANGAIVITTKRGTKQLHVSYSGKLGVSNLPKQVEVFSGDEFRSIVTDHFSSDPTAISLLGGANTNWQNEIYRPAISQDHHVDVSGSIKEIPFRVAVGRTNQNGIIKTSSNDRTTASASLNPTFFDNHLKISMTLNGIFSRERIAPESVVRNAIQFDPTQPIKNGDGSYFALTSISSWPPANPVALLNLTNDRVNADRYIGNVTAEYWLLSSPEMRVVFSYGEDYVSTKEHKLIDTAATWLYFTNGEKGIRQEVNQTMKSEVWDLSFNYSKKLDSFSSQLDLSIGTSNTNNSLTADNYRASIIPQTILNNSSYNVDERLGSIYARAGYSIKDKYLLNVCIRRETDDRFADGNKGGLSYVASLKWKMKDEAFLQNNNAISKLDLRAGYGLTGSNWQFGTSFGGAMDPNLKREKISTISLGADYGLFQNRIYGSIDFYSKTSSDLFLATPAYTLSVTSNAGKIRNTGAEFSINATTISTKDWNMKVGFNAAYNQNKILSLIDLPGVAGYVGLQTGYVNGWDKVMIQSTGYPRNSFYVYEQDYDSNGNPVETSNPYNYYNLRHYKKAEPDWIMGISSQLSYRNWDFAFSGRLSLGNYVYNNVAADSYFHMIYQYDYLLNVSKSVNKTKFTTAQYLSNYYVENASFFRMDYITLGYSFKNVWNRRAAIRLSATIQNAFVITNYSGIDPEQATGIDQYGYPRARTYSMGLNINF